MTIASLQSAAGDPAEFVCGAALNMAVLALRHAALRGPPEAHEDARHVHQAHAGRGSMKSLSASSSLTRARAQVTMLNGSFLMNGTGELERRI